MLDIYHPVPGSPEFRPFEDRYINLRDYRPAQTFVCRLPFRHYIDEAAQEWTLID